ncbi:TonB-dependent receptor [Fulvivirga lutea]|uniref:TonB-dependent receptor n=1 Tax=Fulvivirga lutea TaxID=2810512 RepID=A0A974WGD9_9BACT|nr:TonB-dependent receptor [Fulvivirga lutea]QSE97369.1 TonB-dependent receptor [Fulvivirga lutea]
MSFKYCIAYFLIVFNSIVQAQTSISGKVLHEGEPIVGATVQIVGTKTGAVADVNGYFKIENVESNEVSLEIRAIGYKPTTKTVKISSGENQQLNINLEISNLGLDEVVITGTMQPKYITDSPVKVEVVTSNYMNTFTPAAASSIVEGIKLVNGIQQVTACGVCFTNSISINGLPGPYTAILMDGTPIYGSLASVYGLNGIPSMIIDRFEVIKGPSSTLYGSEAVAGVINVITKDPDKQPSFSVDVMGTSHLESFGNIAGTIKGEKASGFLGLNYAYINDFDDDNKDGFGDNINLDRYSLFTKWDIKRPSKKRFTIAGKVYYEDRRNGVEEFLVNRNYKELRGSDEVYGESIYTERAELFGTYQLNSLENIRLDYSFSTHNQDSYYGADHYKAEQHIGFANLVWDKPLDSHNLIVGLTNRYQSYDDNTVATRDSTSNGIVNKPDNQYIPGVFVQDEWQISKKFMMLTGVRLDHYNLHGPILSPRLNLKYKLGPWTSVRTNLGTGFRVVNLFTEDHAFVSGQREVEIQGDLKPEQSYNASININHVYTIGESQGMIDIDAYYTYFTNKIIPDYDTPNKIIYANTEGHAITKGLGFNVNHDFQGPLAISVGFNWQDVTQTEPNEFEELVTSDIEFAQQYSGVITANYEFKRAGITLGYTARLSGPMALPEVFDLDESGNPLPNARPTESDPFYIHNFQVTKSFNKGWSVYGGLQNIFDYRQPISPLVGFNDPNANIGFSESFDTSYAFAPIHGRELYLGVRWNLN